jgi:hypothetical protein
MPDLMNKKLGAYLDGELSRRDKIELETHLETCPGCKEELEELRRLSNMLHTTPEPGFTPALDFRAQLMLQLPRREEALHAGSNSQVLPWMAPTLVLAGWIFIQVTLGLSTLLLLANQAGFLDGAGAWVNSSPQQTLWFMAVRSLIGSGMETQGLAGLEIINDAGLFFQNLLTLLLWQVGAAALYWGVLSLTWRNRVKELWTSFTSA